MIDSNDKYPVIKPSLFYYETALNTTSSIPTASFSDQYDKLHLAELPFFLPK